MSFAAGHATRVFVNEKEVSGVVSGWSTRHARNMSEVTVVGQTYGQAGAKFIPGLRSGTVTLRGPQDDDETLGLHKELNDAVGVDNNLIITCLPDSDAVGRVAGFTIADLSDWGIDAQVSDAVGYTMACQSDDSMALGYVLHSLAAETADGNGTAVDRGASPLTPTARGLEAVVHMTAYATLTNIALKIQHSVDNSVWADLVSFTTRTGIGAEKVSVSESTTVNRYLRVVTDVTGSGSATFLVAAAPR